MRVKKNNKRFLFCMNLAAIGCIFFMVALFLIHYVRLAKFENKSTVVYEDMKEEETIEGFSDILDLVSYINNALSHQDVDAFLRGCAIKEKVDNYPFNYMLTQKRPFDYDVALLPSGNYEEYEDVNTLMITEQFLSQYKLVWDNIFLQPDGSMKKNSIIMFEDTRVLYPDRQMSEEKFEEQKTKASRWNAEFFVELGARIITDEDSYLITYTVARYDGHYKLFSLKSSLVNWGADTIVRSKTKLEFIEMTGYADIEKFTSQVESLMVMQNEDIEELQSDQALVKQKEKESSNDAVPPLNYYVVDQLYGDSSEEVINAFFLELLRNNTKKAMNYCQIYKEGDILEDVLYREADIARQISYLYKGFARLPYMTLYYFPYIPENSGRNEDGSIDYDKLEFEKKDVLYMLDPSLFYTMHILKVSPVKTENEGKKEETLFVVRYYNQTYQCAFTTVKTKKGWQISSFSSDELYLKPGEVRKY